MKNKKAMSAVITTILLILLSIAALSIIAGAILPFVRNNLDRAKECFEIQEVADALTIKPEGGDYACYYNIPGGGSTKGVNVTIHRGDIELQGFKISVVGDGISEVFDSREMTGGLPAKKTKKTYSINTNLDEIKSVIIAPVAQSGKVCPETDSMDIEDEC